MCLECGCGEHTALVCPECGGRVILINEKAKCLSCGASPALDSELGAPKAHHHHHHHGEGGGEEREVDASQREELLKKLRVLVPHWIEHNVDHAESFHTWADQAWAAGERHTAAHIEEAASRMEAANRDLNALLEHIGAAVPDEAREGHDHEHDHVH